MYTGSGISFWSLFCLCLQIPLLNCKAVNEGLHLQSWLPDLETLLVIPWASCLIMVTVQTLPTYLKLWYKLTCYSNTTSWEDFKSCFGLSQFVCYTGMKFWLITGNKKSPIYLKLYYGYKKQFKIKDILRFLPLH